MPRFSYAGTIGVIEADLATGRSGLVLRCRLQGNARDLSRLQRHLNRAINERRSGRVLAGMVLLLALCGWISGGEEGVRWALAESAPHGDDMAISPEQMQRRFGARKLHRHEMPALFQALQDICRRVNLERPPDIYYIAAPNSMNAYALGGPDRSAITLTEGLLRGMTMAEVTGILAHEVAHISNNDGWAMRWAAALHRAIALTSLTSLLSLQAQGSWAAMPGTPLAVLLSSASTISQLLYLALSRVRELDADAVALELIDDPSALVTALCKLERHHTALPYLGAAAPPPTGSLVEYLRSHPETSERVGILISLSPCYRPAQACR